MPMIEIRVDADEALTQLNEAEIVEYFGADDLLQEIGRDAAIEYWDIKEAED